MTFLSPHALREATVGFFSVLLALLPIAAVIWALGILYRLSSSLEDLTARLERIEKMVRRTRTDTARD